MPCRSDHSRQRFAAKAPSKTANLRLGDTALRAPKARSVSRSWAEAGTTAAANQPPAASTGATRLRPGARLSAFASTPWMREMRGAAQPHST